MHAIHIEARVKGARMGVRVGFLQGSVGFLQRAFIKVNSQQWQSIPTAFMFNPLHLEIIEAKKNIVVVRPS